MRSIGLRAAPRQITYAIVEDSPDETLVLDISRVLVPEALGTPDQYRYLRTTFLDIIDEYGVTRAGLRLAETSAKNVDLGRVGIEAVLQELLASSPVEQYFAGRLMTIAARIDGLTIHSMKPLIEGELAFRELETWPTMKAEERESVLAAVAALSPRS